MGSATMLVHVRRSAVPFTLIELLVVMSIIVLLTGLVLAVMGPVMKNMKASKTKAEITQLVLALESYNQDWGYYPQMPGATELTGTTGAAFWNGSGTLKGIQSQATGKYFFNAADFPAGPNGELRDAFSQPFCYQCPGTINGTSFDLWSRGADGKFGPNKTTVLTDSQVSDAAHDNCDDIANWKKMN